MDDKLTVLAQIRDLELSRTPDYARISQLVTRAKGPDRTMQQFAEVAQIGPSTLSRIANMLIKKPLSKEVIAQIYVARYDSNDFSLLEALATANGYYPKEQRSDSGHREVIERTIQLERQMKNILIAGVVACGLPVTQVLDASWKGGDALPTILRPISGDLVLSTQVGSNTKRTKRWVFELNTTLPPAESSDRVHRPRSSARMCLERYSRYYLTDAWQPESLNDVKISFVFIWPDLYNAFISLLEDAQINNEMTAILIDQQAGTVVQEEWLPGKFVPPSSGSIFSVPQTPTVYKEEEDQ